MIIIGKLKCKFFNSHEPGTSRTVNNRSGVVANCIHCGCDIKYDYGKWVVSNAKINRKSKNRFRLCNVSIII